MRLVIGPGASSVEDLAEERLAELYAVPARPWLRVTMVGTMDGAATGENGLSGSINTGADRRVFGLLRRLAHAVVVGVGTAEAEGYRPTTRPLVLVSRRARIPAALRVAPLGSVLLATCAAADGLAEARDRLGADQVLVLGDHRVDLPSLRERLVARGLTDLLCEGGPHLLRDLLAVGLVDEMCVTISPRLVGGDRLRITAGGPVDVPLHLHQVIEDDGTLLTRWFTARGADPS